MNAKKMLKEHAMGVEEVASINSFNLGRQNLMIFVPGLDA
jgi:hypothetical protein